ncbi:MAG: Ig-like domain-containing protein [Cyclobacteriaceae bacterium]
MKKIYLLFFSLLLLSCERVQITDRTITLQPGQSKQIAVEGDLQEQQFEWRSSNTSVAEVNPEGVVNAQAEGSTFVSLVISSNQQVVDSVRVEVTVP